LGNLEKALTFFEKFKDLEKELYEAYPNNVEFKNGLAISYCKLAQTDKTKSRFYFQKAEKLWEELVRDAPQYVQFQRFLVQVRKDLEKL